MIKSPTDSIEQVLVQITLYEGTLAFIACVYFSPGTDKYIYDNHAASLDRISRSNNFELGMICCYFNLPNVRWVKTPSRLEYYGSISVKMTTIL